MNSKNHFRKLLCGIFLFLPSQLHASFIESTIGTAVVNDATAAYYNPAALTLLKNPQIITMGSAAQFRTHFKGQFTQSSTGFSQTGSTSSSTNYYLPSIYIASPLSRNVDIGFAVIANDFNRDMDQHSILRYIQSNNHIQDVDAVPAFAIKINEFFSAGAALNISYVKFVLEPIVGFPTLNVPDSQSQNEVSGTSLGADAGLLFKPAQTTLIGLNYRSAVTYHLSGTSSLKNPRLISRNYHFDFWTPARSVLSISHFITKQLGWIGTVQYIEWNKFRDLSVSNIPTLLGTLPVIVPNADVHYRLHNSWIFTLGTQYLVTPQWTVRAAGSYLQSPANPSYQIANGDSIVLGSSLGYKISKNVIIDGSYAHAFIKNQAIHINDRNIISGVNSGARDAISLKLTFNV